MPTVEDMQKALNKKRFEDIKKRLEYMRYKTYVEIAERVRIPYKIVRDNWEADSKEIKINRYYPKSAKTIKDFNQWLREEHKELLPALDDFNSFMEYMYLPPVDKKCFEPTEQRKALLAEYEASQQAFKNEQERQYYFTRFLQGYDIASFSMFDCYGSTNRHTQAEYEQFKADCVRLQEDFNQHKEKYFTDYVAADTEQGAEV
jgi:hypothetical protein